MAVQIQDRLQRARNTLSKWGQEHLLTFVGQLSNEELQSLLHQIEQQDWAAMHDLVQRYVLQQPEFSLPKSIEPPPVFPPAPPSDLAERYARARRIGERFVREGKIAAFTVAGGQGTRLGWDGPKGTYPATPLQGKSLFQVFAESIDKTGRKYGRAVPWYIMTSPANDADTRAFFQQHKYFGLRSQDVMFFPQGTVPSFSADGRALLDSPGVLATNPDGHGGSLRALHASGALANMIRRGVEQISYFQVDNPLVRCIDPLFIGLHVQDRAQMSSKMVPKAHAAEKVGVFAQCDGKINVIEYSDLPAELAEAKNADGSLRFNAGSIAIHVIAVEFVQRLNEGPFRLPWHRAVKKVPHVDVATGQRVEPAAPNAVKLETFVFDALQLCDRSIVLETVREEEFGPIKNAEGADSAATSKQLQSQRAARWLEQAGVAVAKKSAEYDAVIELSPLTAIEPEDLRSLSDLPKSVPAGAEISL